MSLSNKLSSVPGLSMVEPLTWQNFKRDENMRRAFIKGKIRKIIYFRGKQNSWKKNWLKNLPEVAKMIEHYRYRKASCLNEYLDPNFNALDITKYLCTKDLRLFNFVFKNGEL